MTALTEAQKALVLAFQKESDDKTLAIVKDMFNVHYGTMNAVIGDNNVSFTTAYDDANYIVDIAEALDANGTDLKAELQITKQTEGMVINALNICTIKWQTSRQTPKINFWT